MRSDTPNSAHLRNRKWYLPSLCFPIVLSWFIPELHLRPTFGRQTVVKPVLWFYPVQKGNHWKQPCRFSANAFPAQRLIRQLDTWSWDHFPATTSCRGYDLIPMTNVYQFRVRHMFSSGLRYNQIINSSIENSSGFNHHAGCCKSPRPHDTRGPWWASKCDTKRSSSAPSRPGT